jgi:spermidine synthase
LIYLEGFSAAVARAWQPGLGWLTLLRLIFSVLALVPTTILIGATMPVMSRIYATRSGEIGGDVGRLYTVNTAGAVVGCFLTALFLIRLFGVLETIFIGAGLNVMVALGALWLNRRWSATRPAVDVEPNTSPRRRRRPLVQPADEKTHPRALHYLVGAYTVSGFAALGYELVWARILAIHTAHAVYSFAMVLTVYLSGLAMGSLFGMAWLRRRQATILQFAVLQLGVGLLALTALFIFARLPSLPIEVIFGGISITREILYELFLAFITFFPPTLLLGALFPLVTSLYTQEQARQVGLKIGTVSALNTLGAIVGTLVTGFLLIPWLGLRNTAIGLSALNLIIGMGAAWLIVNPRPFARWAAPGAIGLGALAIFFLPPGLYLGFREGPSEHLVFYKEGVETTVAVFDVPDQNFKVSFVNGRNEVPTDEVSMKAFRLLGHLPALLKPDAQNALVLSFGNGIATGTLDTHNIPKIDAVDLSQEMIDAANIYWQENYNIRKSANLQLHVEDARNYLLQTDQQYDIITTDATHPANASSWALFTREFYELISQRLNTDGVFVQWLPFHSLLTEDYQAIIRTCLSVFPHTTLWYTGGTHSFLVVTPQSLTPADLAAALEQARSNQYVRDDLGAAASIQNYLLLDEENLAHFAEAGRLVTDNNAFFFPTNQETARILALFQAIARQP